MDYSEKYANLKILEEQDCIMRGKETLPCEICGKPTQFVDICYEARICSDECEKKLTKGLSNYFSNTEEKKGDFN